MASCHAIRFCHDSFAIRVCELVTSIPEHHSCVEQLFPVVAIQNLLLTWCRVPNVEYILDDDTHVQEHVVDSKRCEQIARFVPSLDALEAQLMTLDVVSSTLQSMDAWEHNVVTQVFYMYFEPRPI